MELMSVRLSKKMAPLNLKVYTMDLHIPELDMLCELLTNLPLALPCQSEENTDYPFLSFEIHGAVLQCNSDVPA